MDPDLEMMRDEQRKQERVLKREVEDAKEKRKAMEREKDEWQLMAESLKAEIERLKADIQKQKEDVSTPPPPPPPPPLPEKKEPLGQTTSVS